MARTHLYVAMDDHQTSCNYGAVICNDIDYAERLIDRCQSNSRSERLSDTVHWLAWDVYHELNNWPAILKASTIHLSEEELRSQQDPDLSLARDLHQHRATLKTLEDWIR